MIEYKQSFIIIEFAPPRYGYSFFLSFFLSYLLWRHLQSRRRRTKKTKAVVARREKINFLFLLLKGKKIFLFLLKNLNKVLFEIFLRKSFSLLLLILLLACLLVLYHLSAFRFQMEEVRIELAPYGIFRAVKRFISAIGFRNRYVRKKQRQIFLTQPRNEPRKLAKIQIIKTTRRSNQLMN